VAGADSKITVGVCTIPQLAAGLYRQAAEDVADSVRVFHSAIIIVIPRTALIYSAVFVKATVLVSAVGAGGELLKSLGAGYNLLAGQRFF
jgi:hypothetical protein